MRRDAPLRCVAQLGLAALASACLALARLVARVRRPHLGQRLALEQVSQVLGGVDRERDATLEELGQGWPRGLAAEECHHTLDVILHGRLRDGGGDFAATLYLLLRHYPDQVLAVVEREAACTARRAARVAAHLGTKSRVLAWRLARRAQEQFLRPFVERLLAGAGRRVAGVVEARQLVRVLGERGALERALLFRALLHPELLVQACRAV